MAIENLFNKNYMLRRMVTESGRTTEQTVVQTAQCALQANAPGDPRFNEAGVFASHTMYCGGADGVREEDRVYIDGRKFIVIGVADPTGTGHHLEVHLEEKTK